MKFKFSKIILIILVLTIQNINADNNEYRIKSLKIKGNQHFSNGFIRSLMETKEKNIIGKLIFWRNQPEFSKGILESDIRRIIRQYQKSGFISVNIEEPELKYNDKNRTVKIIIKIEEGKRVRVGEINYNIKNYYSEHKSHIKNIITKSLLKENSYFNDSEFINDLKMIEEYYDEKGYPSINVDYKLLLEKANDKVDININLKTGYRSYFGPISFTGVEKTDEYLLKNLLAITEENPYDPLRIKQTRARLQSTGLFRMVSINLKVSEDTKIIPANIYVQENPTYNLSFGVGYGIEDNIRVYTELTRLRFLGGLRRGNLYVKHSALEPVHISFKFFQPAFPLDDSNFNINPFFRKEEEPAYSLQRAGVNTTASHRLSDKTQTYISYTFESNDLKEHSTEIETEIDDFERAKYYQKSSINWGLIRDSSRPDFYPNDGTLFSSIITLSGYGFKSNYRFLRWIGEGRYYQALNSSLVGAFKLKIGMIKSFEDDDYVPYEERFYSGGAYSVRGWSRAMLGPRNIENDPVGGKSIFETMTEFRYALWKQLSGVFFIDCGNVWLDTADFDFNDIHYAAGIGFRYATPVGAARVDFATPVFEGKYSLQFFISLGHAF